MLTNTYLQYGQDKSIVAILGIAYVSASVIGSIIRFFTLLKEKFYNKLPS